MAIDIDLSCSKSLEYSPTYKFYCRENRVENSIEDPSYKVRSVNTNRTKNDYGVIKKKRRETKSV